MASVINNIFGAKPSDGPDAAQAAGDAGKQAPTLLQLDARLDSQCSVSSVLPPPNFSKLAKLTTT